MTNNVQVLEQDTPRQLTLFDLEQLETRIRAGLRTFIDVPTLSRVCGVQV